MPYECVYAHTKNRSGKPHFLGDHLLSVAKMTESFSINFHHGKLMPLAWAVGFFHDIGKFQNAFQEYLKSLDGGKKPQKSPHAPWSAALVYKLMNNVDIRHEIGLTAAGHHSGLSEPGTLTSNLVANYYNSNDIERMRIFLNHILAKNPLPKFQLPLLNELQREFCIRMLFSALIDADRLDTEVHFEPNKQTFRAKWKGLKELTEILEADQQALIEKVEKEENTIVNQIRRSVYKACLSKAASKPGFFRLTVPTGGGKTRSSLAFALRHALVNQQTRIIYAIPYTSIIDQTAEEYRKILGEDTVLEHHSQVTIKNNEEQDEKAICIQLAEENWDSPIIVTTTVQLFESLFANEPSRCRKLHRLAGSVIVLDEAQTLPAELLKPTLQVLCDLVENYRVTVVLCTATQPSLKGEYLQELSHIKITEIVPEYKEHFQKLKRINYERLPVPLSIEELACEVIKHRQVLVILNTRKKATALIDAIKNKECLHLSTLLCGAHRKKVLEKVKQLIKEEKPVCLISTQVVEAGVDLDFPIVYRAIGPLDRIVQAAGRCNRHGTRLEKGRVIIFELQDERTPRGPYKAGLEKAKTILWEYDSPEVLADPEIYEKYFSMLYNDIDLDSKQIQIKRFCLNFPDTAASYHIIDKDTIPVVVQYGEYRCFLNEWKFNPSKENWRRLQPYLVNVFKHEAESFISEGIMQKITEGLFMWEGVYDDVKGIQKIEYDPSDLII